ncbi:MAG: DUF1802 family protein [Verrucomicrobiota bacterium]|nr:DUF1802 family protein [Verrucomicrobiota bacterium]
MQNVAFKEWSLVCDALGRGEQSIILRKGGIAEGRAGFSFQHDEFFLFPTFFHEQVECVRVRPTEIPTSADTITLRSYAKIEAAERVTSLAVAEALAPLHIVSADVVRERFHYEGDGLQVAFVRIFALSDPWSFPDEKRFGGCRSWIDLPTPPSRELRAVLRDEENVSRRDLFRATLG